MNTVSFQISGLPYSYSLNCTPILQTLLYVCACVYLILYNKYHEGGALPVLFIARSSAYGRVHIQLIFNTYF